LTPLVAVVEELLEPANWAARVDEKNLCPRCELHPEERTDKGVPP
jgi:hypothetical protein